MIHNKPTEDLNRFINVMSTNVISIIEKVIKRHANDTGDEEILYKTKVW